MNEGFFYFSLCMMEAALAVMTPQFELGGWHGDAVTQPEPASGFKFQLL